MTSLPCIICIFSCINGWQTVTHNVKALTRKLFLKHNFSYTKKMLYKAVKICRTVFTTKNNR